MRKSISLFVTLAALVGLIPGCNSAWWQDFVNNPGEQVTSFEATVQVGVNAAELAWPTILQAIPPANQAAAQQQFTNALAAINTAEQVLNNAVNAAVAAQTPNPNFMALMQDVTNAVNEIISIIDLYNGSATSVDAGAHAVAPSVATLHSSYQSLTHYGVKLK